MSDAPRQPPEGTGQPEPGTVPSDETTRWSPSARPTEPTAQWPAEGQPPQGPPPQGQPPQPPQGYGQPPQGWAPQGEPPQPAPGYGQPAQGWAPQGYAPPGSYAPSPKRPNPARQLLDGPPRELASLAALLAAALLTLGALFLLLLSVDDFDITFGDRLRIATSVATFAYVLPLLLATALVLRVDDGGRRPGPVGDGASATGALVVGAVASVLLVGRLVADLFAGDGAFANTFGGFAGRLSTFLIDLGALTLTLAVTWWALKLRERSQGAALGAYGPPPTPPGQQWGQGYQPGPGQAPPSPPPG